jgi:hypothetical protein
MSVTKTLSITIEKWHLIALQSKLLKLSWTLFALFPLLNIEKNLIKLVQAQDVFVIDLVPNNQIGPNEITWNVPQSFYYFQI